MDTIYKLLLAILFAYLAYLLLKRLFKAKSRSRQIPNHIKEKVLERFNGECALCLEKEFIEFHHRKKFAEGGEHTYENVIALCPKHHRMANK